MTIFRWSFATFLLPGLHAQQQLWQFPSPPSSAIYYKVAGYPDHDGDGVRDILVEVDLVSGVPNQGAVQIVSGANGSVLWQRMEPSIRDVRYAGDMDGDGRPEIAMLKSCCVGTNILALEIWTTTNPPRMLWQNSGPAAYLYGYAMLGDLDVNGDGRADFVTATTHPSDSRVFVYDSAGGTIYTLTLHQTHGMVVSLGSIGDLDGDAGDDFLVGVNDGSLGQVLLVSGRTGTILRTSYGLFPGDKTCDFVSNLGDIDGDGVNDYAAFPWLTAQRAIVVAWSGQTGQVIRTWNEFANSVITGDDIDLDGVPDLVIGGDWLISSNLYGRTTAYSGRDGAELWRVDNTYQPNGGPGYYGWMEYSASLGAPQSHLYPAIAWLDVDWWVVGTIRGRVRAFRTTLAGQGPITGAPCSSRGEMPLIGMRQIASSPPSLPRTRLTVARGPAGAGAWLDIDLASRTSFAGVALPVSLDPYGLPGCLLHVGPVASQFRVLGTGGLDRGYAYADFAWRPTTSVLGLAIAAQWLLFDPATLDYAATARHAILVQ